MEQNDLDLYFSFFFTSAPLYSLFSFIDLPRLAEFSHIHYFFYCTFFFLYSSSSSFLFFSFYSMLLDDCSFLMTSNRFLLKEYFWWLFFKLLLARMYLLFSHYSFSPFLQTGFFNWNFPNPPMQSRLFFFFSTQTFPFISTSCCQLLWFFINESFFYVFYWSIFILSGIFSLFIFFYNPLFLYLFYCPPGTY